MDFYIVSALTELGIIKRIPLNFPNAEQMSFIKKVMKDKNSESEIQSNAEELADFEQNGLQGLVSAKVFFRKLRQICGRGSYKSASIRMDIQISTRSCEDAPDCKLNMAMKTKNWTETLNIAPSTADELLKELQNAKTFIRSSKLVSHANVE